VGAPGGARRVAPWCWRTAARAPSLGAAPRTLLEEAGDHVADVDKAEDCAAAAVGRRARDPDRRREHALRGEHLRRCGGGGVFAGGVFAGGGGGCPTRVPVRGACGRVRATARGAARALSRGRAARGRAVRRAGPARVARARAAWRRRPPAPRPRAPRPGRWPPTLLPVPPHRRSPAGTAPPSRCLSASRWPGGCAVPPVWRFAGAPWRRGCPWNALRAAGLWRGGSRRDLGGVAHERVEGGVGVARARL
jgi:hypothetical protein